jgi:hypothetical protein
MERWDKNGSWGGEWMQVAQDRGRRRAVENSVMNPRFLSPGIISVNNIRVMKLRTINWASHLKQVRVTFVNRKHRPFCWELR